MDTEISAWVIKDDSHYSMQVVNEGVLLHASQEEALVAAIDYAVREKVKLNQLRIEGYSEVLGNLVYSEGHYLLDSLADKNIQDFSLSDNKRRIAYLKGFNAGIEHIFGLLREKYHLDKFERQRDE
ncbi:hypothetical protein QUW35_02980 [Ligilactobacillus agilis]|uniref:hypothetical protein n=1 Tax=Ligilactobacillus agilis TaxID=1601 RepID=UPI0025A405E0|nr:hypothetical protein [Ligilactobacillus agilis]MDM8279657.1 hypothetical protein [Ligilactobacillus agilis]